VTLRPALAKIGSLEDASRRVADARAQGRTVALANGCFDLLHVGHVRYLAGARAEADLLVVGVNGDDSVRRLKGAGRPLLDAPDRALLVAALRCVPTSTARARTTRKTPCPSAKWSAPTAAAWPSWAIPRTTTRGG
jgi:cytidyltransferase-like protein